GAGGGVAAAAFGAAGAGAAVFADAGGEGEAPGAGGEALACGAGTASFAGTVCGGSIAGALASALASEPPSRIVGTAAAAPVPMSTMKLFSSRNVRTSGLPFNVNVTAAEL